MEAGGRHHSLGQPGHLGPDLDPDLVPEHPDDRLDPDGDGDDRLDGDGLDPDGDNHDPHDCGGNGKDY